jgi:hypothetical protein
MLASPNMEAKFQLLSLETPLSLKTWLIIIEVISSLIYAKKFVGLVLGVGSSFLLNPTLDTSPKSHH